MSKLIEVPKTPLELVEKWLPDYVEGELIYINFQKALTAFAKEIERRAKESCQEELDNTFINALPNERTFRFIDLYKGRRIYNTPSVIKE